MTSVEAYELLLLAQMENQEVVSRALRSMGVDASALALAGHLWRYVDLINFALREDAHHPLLGLPTRIDAGDGTPLCAKIAIYHLPLWPQFELQLLLKEDHWIQDVRLARPPGDSVRRLGRADLLPGEVVMGDIPRFCEEAFSVETWWPMKTLHCTLLGEGREECLAVFRFGLLQRIIPWGGDGGPRPEIEFPGAYHYRAGG